MGAVDTGAYSSPMSPGAPDDREETAAVSAEDAATWKALQLAESGAPLAEPHTCYRCVILHRYYAGISHADVFLLCPFERLLTGSAEAAALVAAAREREGQRQAEQRAQKNACVP